MFDFGRITLLCLEKRFSKHKMTIFSKNLGGHGPFGHPWLRLCTYSSLPERSDSLNPNQLILCDMQ